MHLSMTKGASKKKTLENIGKGVGDEERVAASPLEPTSRHRSGKKKIPSLS